MTKCSAIEDMMISAFNALVEEAISYKTYKDIMCLTIPNLQFLNIEKDEYELPEKYNNDETI